MKERRRSSLRVGLRLWAAARAVRRRGALAPRSGAPRAVAALVAIMRAIAGGVAAFARCVRRAGRGERVRGNVTQK